MSVSSREAAVAAEPYEFRLFIFILALLTARLTANAFARTDLVFNEAQYWAWSRELAFGYFSKRPLIAWLIRGTTEICGNAEACLRSFPPVIKKACARVYRAGHWSSTSVVSMGWPRALGSDVRFGSKADATPADTHVRNVPGTDFHLRAIWP